MSESPLSILYVDDERDLLTLCKLFLERHSEFSVDTCIDATQALERLKTKSYDAILSDYQMPGMDGLEFLKQVRSRHGDLPFILFTGRGREEVVIRAIDNGVDFYLQKGGDPKSQFAELSHKLKKAVERNQALLALAKSEERMRLALDGANEGLWDTNIVTGELYMSPRGCEMLGYTLEEVQKYSGSGWSNLIHPDDLPIARAALDAYFQGKAGLIQNEQRVLMKSGEWKWVLTRGKVVESDEQGRPVRFVGTHTDITEKKKAEADLNEKSEYLNQIFSSVKEGIAIIDANTHEILDVNPAAIRMIGAEKKDIISRPCHSFICPAETGHYPITDLHQPGDNSERELITVKGTRLPIIKYVVPFIFQGRKCLLETFFDNSERKKEQDELLAAYEQLAASEEELRDQFNELSDFRDALQESESKFRTIVETSPDLIWEITTEGVITYISPRSIDILGHPPVDLIGTSIISLIPADRVEETKTILGTQFSLPAKLISFDVSIINRSGQVRSLNIRASPVFDFHGVHSGFRGVGRDVTEQMASLNALHESEARFNQVADDAGEWIWEVDETGVYQFCSRAVSRILGYEPKEIEGNTHLWNLIEPNTLTAGADTIIASFQVRAPIRNRINPYIRKDGEMVILKTNGSPFFDTAGEFRGYRGTHMDMTYRKNAENSLRLINRHLSLLNTITRHDMMNTITSMHGFLELATEMDENSHCKEYLSRVKSGILSIKNQIEFAEIYQDIGIHEPQWQEIARILPHSDIPPSVTFVADLEDVLIRADPMLEKIFFNLLDNSLRHGGKVTVIRVSGRIEDGMLRILWEDNGEGILPEDKERIFERGFGKNTGFGLFLVREILSLTCITIQETGIYGEGARFELSVPNESFRRDITG